MALREEATTRSGHRREDSLLWVIPLAGLVGIWLWLTFSSGGRSAREWLLPVLALGLFGLVAAIFVAYPRRPRQLSMAVLAFFAGYTLWVAASAIWSASTTRAWLETGRTLGYLLAFVLAVIYFSDGKARRGFRYLLMAAAVVLLSASVWSLWTASDPSSLFHLDRLAYPTGDPDGAAALFLMLLWPLMWLASGKEERAPVRGLALGLTTGLLGLAVMTQSRVALWSLAITTVLMFLLFPARSRLLFYILVPGVLIVYEFPRLHQYSVNGAGAIGGGQAARTVVVAALAAAFIGTVLALLERWIKVSGRMKAIFGAIVLLACLGGLIYGAVLAAEGRGGPYRWISQTWRSLAEHSVREQPSETEPVGEAPYASDSTGDRMDIWRVAWRQVGAAPLLGVGADNFVFEYDRLRTVPSYGPRRTESFSLQLLAETGIVGGVLALGGAMLAVAGVLWPRFAAGWTNARATWLRARRARSPEGDDRPGSDDAAAKGRWGSDPVIYGWEMALLMGTTYWFVHANMQGLWQMAGVSLPALFMIAASVAKVDARAELMWPRLNRESRPSEEGLHNEMARGQRPEGHADGPGQEGPDTAAASDFEDFLPLPRRSERHAGKSERRRRKAARRRRSADLLVPPGPLSRVFRVLLAVLSVLVLLVAGLPYLSYQFQDSAQGLSTTDPLRAVARVEAVRWLVPGDPGPYQTEGAIYAGAARRAIFSDDPERAGVVLDNLALALAAQSKTAELEPANWTSHYRAAWAAVDLLLARAYIQYGPAGAGPIDMSPYQASFHDWSALAGVGPDIPAPGEASASPAKTAAALTAAAANRALTQGELHRLALEYVQTAEARSPLESQVRDLRRLIESISP